MWICGGGSFPNPDVIAAISTKLGWQIPSPTAFVPPYLLLLDTTQLTTSVSHALGEEIGWRGFLAPHLAGRLGFTLGAMLTGIVWTAWHVPILLFADYNSGTPWWFSLPCFTVMVAALSIMLTWLRRRSNSV